MLRLFCLGFPKTGTCTIQAALEGQGLKVAHSSVPEGRVAPLLYTAYSQGKDPMLYLPYDALVHPSICMPSKNLNYWPQMDLELLSALRKYHPQAVFCLNTRKVRHLRYSIEYWRDQQERYLQSNLPGLPPGKGKGKEMGLWINWHWNRMREFFADDPNFIEIDIEDAAQSKRRLSRALGVKIKEWPWLNKNLQKT